MIENPSYLPQDFEATPANIAKHFSDFCKKLHERSRRAVYENRPDEDVQREIYIHDNPIMHLHHMIRDFYSGTPAFRTHLYRELGKYGPGTTPISFDDSYKERSLAFDQLPVSFKISKPESEGKGLFDKTYAKEYERDQLTKTIIWCEMLRGANQLTLEEALDMASWLSEFSQSFGEPFIPTKFSDEFNQDCLLDQYRIFIDERKTDLHYPPSAAWKEADMQEEEKKRLGLEKNPYIPKLRYFARHFERLLHDAEEMYVIIVGERYESLYLSPQNYVNKSHAIVYANHAFEGECWDLFRVTKHLPDHNRDSRGIKVFGE